MNSGKIKAVLFIIVFLLVTAVVASWFVSRDPAESGDPAGAGATIQPVDELPVVITPEPTAVLITPQPKVTPSIPKQAPAPTPVPTPVPTPIPTPEPTPEPVYGVSLGEGSFSSQYGLGIDLAVDWSVTTLNANEVSVTVTARVLSGALDSGAMPLGFNVGGQYVTLTAAEVHYGDTGMAYNRLGSQTFTVSAPAGQITEIPVQANWQFNGVYGGNEIPVLECGGYINVSR